MTILTVAGADFEAQATEYAAPVTDGLMLWHFLNGSVEKACRNLAPGRAGHDAAPAGAPAASAGYLDCTGLTSYLQTDTPESAAETIIVVSAAHGSVPVSTHRSPVIGTSSGPSALNPARTTFGHGIYYLSGTQVVFGVGRYDPNDGSAHPTSPGLAVADTSVPLLMAARTSDTQGRIDIFTTGQGANIGVTLPRDPSSRPFRIGSTYDAGYDQPARLWFAAVYNRFLSDVEMAAIVANVRAYMARRFGLAV